MINMSEELLSIPANDPDADAKGKFMQAIWTLITDEEDGQLIIDTAENYYKGHPRHNLRKGPCDDLGDLLKSFLDAGIPAKSIARYQKIVEFNILSDLLYMIDDPYNAIEAAEHLDESEYWGVFKLDEDGRPIEKLNALHEPIIGYDPTGREMRPKKD